MSNVCNVIKQRINCVEYCQRSGIAIRKPGDRCVSPLRSGASNKNSFVVYDDFFYDFGSSAGGDVIDLCALLEFGGNRKDAINKLAKIVGAVDDQPRDWVKATQNLNNMIQKWHEQLNQEIRDYLHSRNITDETITDLKIGYTAQGEPDGYASHRISIPYWKNGYTYSYVARASQLNQIPKYLKRRNDDLSDASAPWGVHTLDRTGKPLVIAEGAFDALSFYQEGYPVIATMGGHFSKQQIATVLSVVRNYEHTYLTFDADGPGASFAMDLARTLFLHRVSFSVASIPRPHKDVSDYYSSGGSLPDLLSSAVDGGQFLFLSTSDMDKFKELAFHASRYVDAPELARLFSVVRRAELFDDAWLSALQKQCDRAPSEDVIARRVSDAHQLRYLENVGFYEYIRGCWRRIEDTRVMAYIGDELGRYRTGARLSSILKIVRTDNRTDAHFDRNPVFNFINGTLELSDPPKFREHRPDDLCSVQASYPYNADAHSEEWERFVMDVSDDDPQRYQLLQEMAGYVLFHDCSLETIFVLQGEGGNGKSVYLNALQAVYGKENTSSVSVAGICQDFQRIYLSTSLLNIATEIRSNVSGAEEYLKQIASGETISACYKGQNYIQFNPRCKLFFATNGQLRSSDTSDGLARRLKIVNFTQQFVDNPSRQGERRRDTQLFKRLMSDLPAIFNWCLSGYIMLLRTRDFTTMEDEEETKRMFKEASNPLISFIDDVEIQGAVSKDDLYRMYCDWCEDAGHKKGSRTYLVREIKKLLPEGTKEVETHINGKRFKGFIIPSADPLLDNGELL